MNPVGIVLVGHGDTATHLLQAASGIVPGRLEDVVAVDAGSGETPDFRARLCSILDGVDQGRGVLVIVDLIGASPWCCAWREGEEHETIVLSGLSLAMLLKLASLDRNALRADELAREVADTAHRSVTISATDSACRDEDDQ